MLEVDLNMGRQVYRLSDFDFEANIKDGIAVDLNWVRI